MERGSSVRMGAGDTKPGQRALLPRLRCSPLLKVSDSGMHMGGTLSTLFWFFSFYFFIFYFCGDPKMGYNTILERLWCCYHEEIVSILVAKIVSIPSLESCAIV